MKKSCCFPDVVVRCTVCLLVILFVLGSAHPGAAQSAGTWIPADSMNSARYANPAVLMPDGTALLIGGYNLGTVLGSVERYDSFSNTWSWMPNCRARATRTPPRCC